MERWSDGAIARCNSASCRPHTRRRTRQRVDYGKPFNESEGLRCSRPAAAGACIALSPNALRLAHQLRGVDAHAHGALLYAHDVGL